MQLFPTFTDFRDAGWTGFIPDPRNRRQFLRQLDELRDELGEGGDLEFIIAVEAYRVAMEESLPAVTAA